ncbi:gliding motility lipoprotein GldH [Pontibacter arcticus]|uniref:Gliding motility lipoprotein GldH n=1 Tax=Pontibacter arcticus TaxID=2080288 RepID=A0A364RHI7_9BACT|nr:gliding motility lipoprotein GldH [Pontibacter arcticus]RAU83761.1 gliding motility lipoprotein GldH [Pontibacter arcticus]
MRKSVILLSAILLMLLTACEPGRIYEQNADFESQNWEIDNAPVFSFEITDTTKVYDVYFNVRYNLQYEFYNLYVRHQLTGPDNTMLSAAQHELLLLDAKTGKPLGKGSSDIYDLQVLALKDVKFEKVGKHTLTLTQYMRRDPLPHILAVGIKVTEKSN